MLPSRCPSRSRARRRLAPVDPPSSCGATLPSAPSLGYSSLRRGGSGFPKVRVGPGGDGHAGGGAEVVAGGGASCFFNAPNPL